MEAIGVNMHEKGVKMREAVILMPLNMQKAGFKGLFLGPGHA